MVYNPLTVQQMHAVCTVISILQKNHYTTAQSAHTSYNHQPLCGIISLCWLTDYFPKLLQGKHGAQSHTEHQQSAVTRVYKQVLQLTA